MEQNLEKALWKDYEFLSEKIEELADKEISMGLLEEKDKIRQELLKLEISINECKIKEKEINTNSSNNIISNRIAIGTFAISTIVSLYTIAKTFKFDQESTVTSTLGRNILNGFIPKMLKK